MHTVLDSASIILIFAAIVLTSIYFLYVTAKHELAPMEDQGIVIAQLTTAPNATLEQTELYSTAVNKIYQSFPETERIFTLDGISGLNSSIIGIGI